MSCWKSAAWRAVQYEIYGGLKIHGFSGEQKKGGPIIMAQVIFNRRLSQDFYLMRVAQPNEARMGQFCMLRAWDRYPLLSRPVSVFDADPETLSFLYRTVGEGTIFKVHCFRSVIA